MKRFVSLFIAALLLCACNSDRDNILKVYNWSNYIGEGVVEDFEQWYAEQTGEEIKVIYQTFDINETMLSQIEKGREDYDITCPSDYVIERMLNNGLLLPLDFASLPDSINYIKNNRSPYFTDLIGKVSSEKNANDYAVAFMWGTVGLLYNPRFVTDEEASTWEAIRNPKFDGQILIKNAPRDVFSSVLIYLRQEELSSGQTTLEELMFDSSEEAIADVERFMADVSPKVAGWEADFGKELMTQEKAVLSLNWSGDAVWAIEEAADVGVELRYTVPQEGSSVWFDGWVIPKYAHNVKAATYFIDFMCRPDIAIRNMEETGYVSSNGDISVLESQIDTTCEAIDLSYFFGDSARSVCVSPALYPDKSTIEKCALMHDWGDRTDKLISMWSRVMGSDANAMTIIVIGLFLVVLLAFGIRKRFFGKKKYRKH